MQSKVASAVLFFALAPALTLGLTACQNGKAIAGRTADMETNGPALIKLGPNDAQPEVAKAYARKSFYLDRSLDQSIGWFQKPSSKQWYPFKNQGSGEEVCTHEQAASSLIAFKDLLATSKDAEEFKSRFLSMFDVWQSVGWNEEREVLFTGYFSPIFHASATPTDQFQHALYRRPADLVTDPLTGQPKGRRAADGSVEPYPTRSEIEASGMLKGSELVYLESPLDVYIVQVNGSAKLLMPDNSVMYVGYAGKTDRPYFGLGRAMVDAGLLRKSQLSLSSIRRAWEKDPSTVDALIAKNESYVFFTEYPEGQWPKGSLGVRVSEDASIATDKTIFPRGGLTMVDTLAQTFARENIEFVNFMLDQDTGGAIRAAGRADLYMGSGPAAELLAGGQYANGKLFYFFLKPEFVSQYPLPEVAKVAPPIAPRPTKG